MLGDVGKDEVGKFWSLTVLRLRGGCSKPEEAGGRIKQGIGRVVEGSGGNLLIFDSSTGKQECLGAEEVGEANILCVLGDSLLAWSGAILY